MTSIIILWIVVTSRQPSWHLIELGGMQKHNIQNIQRIYYLQFITIWVSLLNLMTNDKRNIFIFTSRIMEIFKAFLSGTQAENNPCQVWRSCWCWDDNEGRSSYCRYLHLRSHHWLHLSIVSSPISYIWPALSLQSKSINNLMRIRNEGNLISTECLEVIMLVAGWPVTQGWPQ